METKLKQYQQIKLGQVWKRQVYSSGLSDNEYRGDAYYLVIAKQSMGQWKLALLAKEPKDMRLGYDRFNNQWIKGKEIREELVQVDPEPFKTAIVLFG